MGDSSIIIARGASGYSGYEVRVLPQIVDDGLGWEFREHAQALEWAEVMHQQVGLPIVDQAGGAEHA